MGVKKKTLSFPEEVWSVIESNARLAHKTPSAYVSELIMEHEHLQRGITAVEEWAVEHGGAFTAEEDAWADRLLDAVDRMDGGVIELDTFEPMPDSLKPDRG
jgi:hypothetical protein